MNVRFASSFFALIVVACTACTGGSNTSSTDGGTGSSSGSSTSSSGTGSSSGGAGACTELHPGATNDPLGGNATSEVLAQAGSDLSGATSKQLTELLGACRNIAVALDVSAANQNAADAQTDEKSKTDAWCKLAVTQIGTAKAQAGGTISLTFQPSVCKLSVQSKATCQGTCAGTGPCDVSANPMICSGGQLSSTTCDGGKLEGGCKVDARCDQGCDVSVIAAADCPAPTVSVASSGSSDPTTAAKLEAALEADLPTVIALKSRCDLEVNVVASFSGSISAVTDIKPACIPPLVSGVARSTQEVQACAQAANAVVATVN